MTRVVITGIGLLTPLGTGQEATWEALVEGKTAIAPIESFDASSLHTRIGAEVKDFDPKRYIENRRTVRMTTRNDQFAIAGAFLAMQDAGLGSGDGLGERGALFIGGNKEISDPMHVRDATEAARGPDGVADMSRFGESAMSTAYPLFFVEGLQAASLFYVSQAFGIKGANTYFTGKGEAGMLALGRAFRAVKRGEADLALAGGFDDAVSWWSLSKMDDLGFLTENNDLGPRALRPFDVDRSGTVIGEGAAFLVLESYEHAQERGATIYAEITGYGNAHDAYRLLEPHPEGRGMVHAITHALREAEATPADIGYIAAEGDGTIPGDASEARAIETIFGDGASRAIGSSVKPATGHMVAAAGALNAAVATLALYHGCVPPTLNLEHLDPACTFDWTPGEARTAALDGAVALTRGMEGQNIALVLRAVR